MLPSAGNSKSLRKRKLLWEGNGDLDSVNAIQSTYPLQRMQINSGENVRKLKVEWPFCLKKVGCCVISDN